MEPHPEPATDPADVPRVPHRRTARRLPWEHLPPAVREEVARRCGSPVVDATSQDSGFTPGLASVLTCADGQRVFLKAAHRTAQRPYAEAYAREVEVLGHLPLDRLPVPRPRWHVDDASGWFLVAFDHVVGRPPHRPWRDADLEACLDVLGTVAATLTRPDAGLGLRPLHEELPTLVTGWDLVAAAQVPWPHLAELRTLARAYPHLPDLGSFVHSDARDDNFLVREDGSAVLCDWNWPALGPPWLDVVLLLVSAWGDGIDPEPLLADHPLTAGVAGDELDVAVAALGGFMAEADLRPVPSTSPWLGVHRRWWAAACWSWLASRRGWQ